MTDTIHIPDYITVVTPLIISEVAQVAADLLAANTDLPAPCGVHVGTYGGDDIEMQFSHEHAAFDAMALWAERTGGTITAEPGTDKDGPYVRCLVRFTYRSARVRAYAYIRSATA